MRCERIQVEVSRALDEGRDLAPLEGHLSVCSNCSDFARASLEIGERYRRQVRQGIDRLRRGTPPAVIKRSPARWLIPLAASLLVLGSVPSRPESTLPAISTPVASARVPLFDEVRIGSVELQLLAWSGESPLPRRLAQDLPSSFSFEFEPSVALPSSLRF